MPLEDIGGGNKMYKFEAGGPGGPIEQVKNVYSLAELAAKIRQAPAQLLSAQAEAVIKAHEADPTIMAVKDANNLAELQAKIGAEGRAKMDFALKGYASLPGAFTQNFNMGKQILKMINPAAHAVDNGDGTFAMGIPQPDGSWNVIHMDPNRLGDPKERQVGEQQLREGWTKVGEGWATVDEFYRNMSKLNAQPNPSGPGDVGVLFSYMKMFDRKNSVRENQYATAENAPGISEQFRNLYNRARDSQGPVLGPAGSPSRLAFQHAADIVYGNARQDAVMQAKFFAEGAKAKGLDPKLVVAPFGGITADEVLGGSPQLTQSGGKAASGAAVAAPASDGSGGGAPAGLPAPGPQGPPSSDAGYGGPAGAAPAPSTQQAAPAGQRARDTLKNMFQMPDGGQ